MKKKFMILLAVLLAFALLTGCAAQNAEPEATSITQQGAQSTPEQTPDQTTTSEPTQELKTDAGPQATGENNGENDMPTISGLGIDRGNYNDEDAGFFFNIQSTAWGGADEDIIYCKFTLYDTEFAVNILYPKKVYEIHFGDGLWYQYDSINKDVVDPWFDVDLELEKIAGDNSAGLNEEIVKTGSFGIANIAPTIVELLGIEKPDMWEKSILAE